MAPSSTKGAVTRLLRNAAMNVTVFQFPCSTFWTSRSPCGARPSNPDLLLCQSVLEFGQRDVRLLRYQLPHQILVRRQREILVAAELGRADAARFPVQLEE